MGTDSECMLYVDDPTVIITQDSNDQKPENTVNTVKLDCFVGLLNQKRTLDVSLLSPYPENKLLVNYSFLFWGAQQIEIAVDLW